jgi:hypothetical protein
MLLVFNFKVADSVGMKNFLPMNAEKKSLATDTLRLSDAANGTKRYTLLEKHTELTRL